MSETINLSYRYGLFPPTDWGEDCEREIRLQTQLWNRLVAIEQEYRAILEQYLRAASPDYNELQHRVAVLTDMIDLLMAERATQRKLARRRIAIPELDDRIETAIAQRRQCWSEMQPVRRAALRALGPQLRALYDQRYQQIAEARRGSGLWWGNSNAVLASFDATLRRLKPGQQVRLRDPDHDANGRLTIQIQRGCPAPLFLAGERGDARIEDDPKKPGEKRLIATVHSAGRGTRRVATWPMGRNLFHRPLPEGAIVKEVTISRRRWRPGTGLRSWQWSVALSLTLPAAPTPTARLVLGIDLGWRKLESGGVRIATIANGTSVDYVILPADWLTARLRVADQGGRLRVETRDLKLPSGIADALRERVGELAMALQQLPKEMRGGARDWLDRYKDLRSTLVRLERRRLDYYRNAAARIVPQAMTLALDRTRMESSAQLPPEARRMARWCAPHELRRAFLDRARRDGVGIVEIEAASTLTCHLCGHYNQVAPGQRSDLIWRCGECHALWDQDDNAAINLRRAVVEKNALAEMAPIPAKAARVKPPRLIRRRAAPPAPDDHA